MSLFWLNNSKFGTQMLHFRIYLKMFAAGVYRALHIV